VCLFYELLEWGLVQIKRPGSSDPVWVCMRTLATCISVFFSFFFFSLFGDIMTIINMKTPWFFGKASFYYSICVNYICDMELIN